MIATLLSAKNIELCWQVLSRYGVFHQRHMVIEECSELIKAVCKLDREDNAEHYESYIEELIDTIVMCQQMLLVERLSADEINNRAAAKLHKALEG